MQHGSGDHFKHFYHRVVVVHTFDPSAQKAKAGGFLEFQDSLGNTKKLSGGKQEQQHANIFDHTCFQGSLPQSSAPKLISFRACICPSYPSAVDYIKTVLKPQLVVAVLVGM